jgi:uncharacterized membrane protein YgcG
MAASATTSATASATAEPRFRTRPLSRDRGGDARSAALAESLVAHQQAISVHHHAMLGEIAEFSRSEAFRGDGALSMAAWLAQHCRLGAAQARTLVTVAEKMEELPRLSDALSEGRLTLDVLAPLAAAATPETDGELAEASAHWTVRQAKELASAARGATDKQAARTFVGRRVRFDDARCSLWVQLAKDAYAVVKSTLVARATRHDHPSTGDADYEPLERRLADALVELCTERGRSDGGSRGAGSRGAGSRGAGSRGAGSRNGGGGGRGGSSGGDGKPVFGGAPTTIIVHADVSLFTDLEHQAEGSASIEGLGSISAEIVRRLSCDAKHTISLEAPDGTILDQFPGRRSPTTAQRIEIARRDNGCRFSGCGYNLITNVHHLRHWIKGGPTVLSNLITLCAAHHSRVHELGWKMSGDANDLVTFTSPHGRQSTSSPSPVWRRSLPPRK